MATKRGLRLAFAAAVRALENGKVYTAATAFTSAAELGARDQREGASGPRLACNYVQQALRLSESPLLTDHQRQDIHERLSIGGS